MKKFFDNGTVKIYVTGMANETNNDYGAYAAEFNDVNKRIKRCINPEEGPDVIYDDSDTGKHSSERYDIIEIGRYDIPFLGVVIDVEEGMGTEEIFEVINLSGIGDIIKEMAPKCDLHILSAAISYYSFVPMGAIMFNGSFEDIVDNMYWVSFSDDADYGKPNPNPFMPNVVYNGLHRALNGEYYVIKRNAIDNNFYGYSVRNYLDEESGMERTGIYLAKWIDWEC